MNRNGPLGPRRADHQALLLGCLVLANSKEGTSIEDILPAWLLPEQEPPSPEQTMAIIQAAQGIGRIKNT